MDLLRVAKVDNVILERYELSAPSPSAVPTRQRLVGTLHLTPHHLIFSPNSTSSTADGSEIWVPYPSITLLTRLPQTIQGHYPLQIRTRTFDSYVLSFETDREGGAEDVWQSVKDCAVAKSVEQLYAFFFTLPRHAVGTVPTKQVVTPPHSDSPLTTSLPSTTSIPSNGPGPGWNAYNLRLEFARQGLGTRTKAWRFTDINKDYSFCPTYPNKLVVPSRISDSVLAYAGKYRSKGRIPALSYLHWANHASITRSSQPMVGLKNARSAQDERLIECIFSAHLFPDTAHTPTSNPLTVSPSPSNVYGATSTNLIIDARPTTNAMANVAMGAGTENMDNYRTGKKAYLGIDNIHVMRNSLKQISEAIKEVEENPSATLDRSLLRKSNWLRHISTLLDGSLVIVKNIHLNASHVLIHCSDGWDRTSQLSAIAQLCLDPYYRTIDGFKVLIEKDWLSFGHKFLDRSGHLSSEKLFTVVDTQESDSEEEFGGAQKAAQAFFASVQKQFTSSDHHAKEISPVFHQFLDCIRQIQRQFPDRFEFNENFLLDVYYHLYACQFGTFLFNSEKERRTPHSGKPYFERTVSYWDEIDMKRNQYRNSTYQPELDDRSSRVPEADQGVLMFNAKDVRYWNRLFKRGDDEMNGLAVNLAQQAQGADVIGPLGADQVDPVSVEGAVSAFPVLASTNDPEEARHVSASVSAPQLPSQIVPVRSANGEVLRSSRGIDGSSAWRWSQLSTGAFSAIQGAARDLRTIGKEAISQIKSEVNEGEMWSRPGESPGVPAPTNAEPLRKPTVRLPSESNPWSSNESVTSKTNALPRATSQSNPWQTSRPTTEPSLERLSVREQPEHPPLTSTSSKAKSASDEEIQAAMGGDQKAWDPLGAL